MKQSFEKMRAEAEKCLAQSERYCTEKKEFEDAVYSKVWCEDYILIWHVLILKDVFFHIFSEFSVL